jgi:decaprenylphospho-beta-D-erythro-pentofuranosid-2-ulose 2-reductase
VINALGEPQRIAILGGTSEIGNAIAEKIAARGTVIELIGRSASELAATAARWQKKGHEVVIRLSDAVNIESHEALMTDVFAADVDVVIVAAGVLTAADPATDSSAATASLQVNGLGATSWMLAAYQHMCRQGHGSLVVLSSIVAVRPRPSNFIYGAGKVMLDFAARGLVDNGQPGVSVLLVRPGFVKTRMTQGRPAAPFAVSAKVVAATVAPHVRAGAQSRVIWVPSVLRYVAAAIAVMHISVLRRIDR